MATRARATERGFATSASLLLVFVGLFVALGALHAVAANTEERVREARADAREHHHAVQETAINVTEATWDGDDNLTLRIENTGDVTLSVSDADTVVDGTYVGVGDYERVEVAGADSDLWRPGEVLVLEDEDTVATLVSTPGRVRVVTETGVADAMEVTVL